MKKRKYGWIKQQPDLRDYDFKLLKLEVPPVLPKIVNLRQWCSPIENQLNLGSCTAHAWAGLIQYNEIKSGKIGSLYNDMSRLFIYYNERMIEGTVNQDSGAELRDGAKSLSTYGVPVEVEWPYNIKNFKKKPMVSVYKDALPNIIKNYHAINTFNDLKICLSQGHPFVFGFMVYSSFESNTVSNTGIVPMPKRNEKILGGHAVLAVGYDDNQKRFLVRNSWGTDWGLPGDLRGYFTIPYDYLANSNLASDFWTVIN
jgi:C1A family cysteine protease